jgi:hypothetical protein
MLLGLLAYVWNYGSNVPGWDEWTLVPVLVGEQPLTLSWLWELLPHNEHRYPLTRLSLWAFARLSGCDFRFGMYVNALTMGAMALAMILVARRLRGRLSYADAFFPLVLLHVGHEQVLLQALAINFTSTTLLACAVLLLLVQSRRVPALSPAMAAGTCLLLLPMVGAAGVALVPALTLWLAWCGFLWWRAPEPYARRNALCLGGLAALAVLVLVSYVLTMERTGDMPALSSDPASVLLGGAQFLTVGLGTAAQPLWPYTGFVVLGVLLLGAAVAVAAGRAQPRERFRALGLLLFLAAMGTLALAIGWGRSELDTGACFEPRYAMLSLPALCAVYFIGVLYHPASGGRLLQMSLLLLACMFFPGNMEEGVGFGSDTLETRTAFATDLMAGVPATTLAQRYAGKLNPSWSGEVHPEEVEAVVAGMRSLHRARVGVFQHLRDDAAGPGESP